MELVKIKEKIKKVYDEATLKKNAIIDELNVAKKQLNEINSKMDEALFKCDIDNHNELLQKKKHIEEEIQFYNDYLNNFDNGPIMSIDVATDLINEIDKSIEEHLNKDYDEFCTILNKLYSIANDMNNYYVNGRGLCDKVIDFSKTNIPLTEFKKVFIYRDVENSIFKIKNRCNI